MKFIDILFKGNAGLARKLVTGLLLAGNVAVASAQRISFSMFFEPQISWLTADTKSINRDESRTGFNTGLIMDKFFTENYAFSTGISILNTGGALMYDDSTTFDFNYGDRDLPAGSVLDYKLQYINIPISLKLNSNQIGYLSFFAHPGICTHFNIKATADGLSDGLDVDNENISDAVSVFNLSYFIGGGIEYSLGGNTAVIAGLFYDSGFWDITRTKDYKATLSSVSLRLGLRF